MVYSHNVILQSLYDIALYSPAIFSFGFIIYLIGDVRQKNDIPNRLVIIGKKIMLFSMIAFSIGFSACFYLTMSGIG